MGLLLYKSPSERAIMREAKQMFADRVMWQICLLASFFAQETGAK